MSVRTIVSVVLATAAVVTGCGGEARPTAAEPRSATVTASEAPSKKASPSRSPSASESTATAAPNDAPSDGTRRGRVIKTANSPYGSMLFDGSDQAIYLFDKETTRTPDCYGACAQAWPPVLTDGPPEASGAARPGLLGTTRRRDGSRQVTYGGQPLYFYVRDDRFEVSCHNVFEYGGLWLVVTPGGESAP